MSATAQFLGSNILHYIKWLRVKDSFLYRKDNAAQGTLLLLGSIQCDSLIASHWMSFTGL